MIFVQYDFVAFVSPNVFDLDMWLYTSDDKNTGPIPRKWLVQKFWSSLSEFSFPLKRKQKQAIDEKGLEKILKFPFLRNETIHLIKCCKIVGSCDAFAPNENIDEHCRQMTLKQIKHRNNRIIKGESCSLLSELFTKSDVVDRCLSSVVSFLLHISAFCKCVYVIIC